MKRRLFNLFALFSLILCGATLVIGFFSYRSVLRTDYRLSPNRSLIFQAYRSEIFITDFQELIEWPISASRPYWEWRFLGFSIGSGDKQGIIEHLPPSGTNNYERIRRITIPCWAVVILSASSAVLFFRRRPPKPGYCAICGYDLRATPGRCPECGMVPEKLVNK